MDELISRQAAIDEAEEWIGAVYCEHEEQRERSAIKKVIQGIKALPSTQPKHGEWETAYLDHVSMGVRPKVLYCSECNQCMAYPTNFCPNCGADMRGEQDDR